MEAKLRHGKSLRDADRRAGDPVAKRSDPRIGRFAGRLRLLSIAMLWGIAVSAVSSIAAEKPSLSIEEGLDDAARVAELGWAIDRTRLRQDLEYLSSEDLRGRGVDSDAIDVAANHLARRFDEIGLRTDLFNGTPMQPVEISLGARAGPPESNHLRVFADGSAEPFFIREYGDGLAPMAIGSDRGRVSGPLAFVGYGIKAPDLNYDDYAGLGVQGCIVMMLRKEPGNDDDDSPFDGRSATRHALFSTKIKTAIQQGATAIILVNDLASVEKSVALVRRRIALEETRLKATESQLERSPADEMKGRSKLREKIQRLRAAIDEMKLESLAAERGVMEISTAGRRGRNQPSIPVISIGRAEAEELIRASGKAESLTQWESRVDETYFPSSFFLSGMVGKLRVEMSPSSRVSNNVIGTIEGKGNLSGQSIVVGAHYDHVGMGGYGSLAPGTIEIHNGADDNASGTAALLAIATQLRPRLSGRNSHRRIIVIAFTGEERGLVGSRYYAAHPRFDWSSTKAMINLDMIGRLRDNELTVYGTGSGDILDDVVETANQRGGFSLFKVPTGFGPSDHQSFYERGVPVLFFFTGLHQDYHRPSDDFEKINFTGLNRITDTVCDVAFDLATRSQAPLYRSSEEKGPPIRRQLTAVMGVVLSEDSDGVTVSGFHPESAAEKAGVQIGDRFENIGKRQVARSVDVLDELRKHNPGDLIRVRLIRQDETIEKTVRLVPRP